MVAHVPGHLTLCQLTFAYSLMGKCFQRKQISGYREYNQEGNHQIKCRSLDDFDNCFMQLLERCKKYFAVKGDNLEEK